MAIVPTMPPAFPVPVLPQSFDTSLSYYELLAKLMEQCQALTAACNENTTTIGQINTIIAQMQETISHMASEEVVEQMQSDITALQGTTGSLETGLAAEIEARQNADTFLQSTLTALINNIATEYVSREELETDYMVGGVTFQIMTQQQYDALTSYVPLRVYFVIGDSDHLTIKYGGGTVGGGSIAGNFTETMRNANTGGVIPFVADTE